jgi:tetratricopeptide (TPR) repeat protein/membrane protease YdiL (CAAX protease family)
MKRILDRSWSLLWLILFAHLACGQETKPASPAQLVHRGQTELASEHWAAAERLFREATELDPQNVGAYEGLGQSLYELERYADSAAAIERAIALGLNTTNGFWGLGSSYYAAGNYQKAADAYQQYTSLKPNQPEGFYWLGCSLFGLNRYGEAEQACRRAVSLNPTNSVYHTELAYCLVELHRYEDAVKALSESLVLNPGNASAYLWLGYSLSQLERYGEAASASRQAIALDSTNSFHHAQLGYCLTQLRRYDEAIKALNESLVLDPVNPSAYLWLGVCRYRTRDYPKAVSDLQECVSLEPTRFDGHSWLGYCLYVLRRYDAAAGSFQKALQLEPDDFNMNYWRGQSLLRLGRFGEATANFEKAHEIKKGSKSLRYWLLYCYLLSAQYEKAYRISPPVFVIAGGALILTYLVGLIILLKISSKLHSSPSPSFGFSFAWLVLFFEGQLAFIFCLGLLSLIGISDSPLTGMMLAGIPIIVATKAFARQPWGGPFAWPLRLGTAKVVWLSLLWLVAASLVGSVCSELIARMTQRPVTVQEVVPIIKHVLNANPLTAIFSVVFVGPIVEEILFRGLIFGAVEKRLRVGGAIFVSSLAFALVHLDVIHFPHIFGIGVVLGWARWKSGSLGLPILIHVLNNGLSLLVLKFFDMDA